MSPATRVSEREVAGRGPRLIELMRLPAFADKFVGELSPVPAASSTSPARSPTSPPSSCSTSRAAASPSAETEALGPVFDRHPRTRPAPPWVIIEHDMPLITSISDELLALASAPSSFEASPTTVINHPRVVEGYLGGRDEVIQRSGTALHASAPPIERQPPDETVPDSHRGHRVFAAMAMSTAPGARAQGSEAATVTDVAWWSATPGQPEPEGGFQVAMDPQGGITSVAAIKLKVNVKTLASALFVFGEGPTKVSEASADVRLCRGLSSDWSGDNANPGTLANAPKADCAKSVQLKRDGTLQSWSGDAANLITGPGTMTLMVVPGSPTNASFPFPSYDNLPRLNPPVALPVGIPPPLPVTTVPGPARFPSAPPTARRLVRRDRRAGHAAAMSRWHGWSRPRRSRRCQRRRRWTCRSRSGTRCK